MAQDAEELHGIQRVARDLGVTARTLRFYEDRGLIAPRRVGTTRIYTRREIGRVQLILRGKRLGFPLRDIKQFLDLYDADPQHIGQMTALAAAARERADGLEQQRQMLDQTIGELREIEHQAMEWVRGAGG